MDIFLRASACVLVALVLYLVLAKQEKDLAVLFSVIVCCIVTSVALSQFEPVLGFLTELESHAGLNSEMLAIVLKAVGIGFIGEITSLVCNDAGNTALAKVLHILCCVIVLWISLPLFRGLLELVEEVLMSI